MADPMTDKIATIIEQCSPEERKALFALLRTTHQIHTLEETFGAPAEVILEAIDQAPPLTRTMLRGVIADSAFRQFTATTLAQRGWRDVTPPGNFAFDRLLSDDSGKISVQVKLQRSKEGAPVITTGKSYGGLPRGMFLVEPQRTRNGTKRTTNEAPGDKSRPYRFGDFDVLAVSLYPSTNNWDSFMYTVGNWLLPGERPEEIGKYQPVARQANEHWTDDFDTVAKWVRSSPQKAIRNEPDSLVAQLNLL